MSKTYHPKKLELTIYKCTDCRFFIRGSLPHVGWCNHPAHTTSKCMPLPPMKDVGLISSICPLPNAEEARGAAE